MGRLFFFIVFLLVSNNALGQTPILRVVPANSVGMVVTITFPPSPTPIDYKLYYRVQGSGQYIYETTFPVPVIVTNTPGEHIIPVSIFNQSDMYEFKLEEVSNPNNQTVVLQSFSEEWCSSTSDILHSFNHPISGNSGTPSYPHEGLDIMGGGNPIYAPRGGWVAQLSVSGQNEQIVLGMYNSSYSGLINPLVPQPPGVIEVVEFNHVVPYNLVSGSSVYPGQLLGHIGVNNSINGPFCTSCENHVHVGYSIDGVIHWKCFKNLLTKTLTQTLHNSLMLMETKKCFDFVRTSWLGALDKFLISKTQSFKVYSDKFGVGLILLLRL